MDTNDRKTRVAVPLATFAEWQALAPDEAAHQIHARLAAMPPTARHAALAFVEREETIAGLFASASTTSPLRGVPCFIKDLFDRAGVPTCAGSTFLPEVRPTPYVDSTIVMRLREVGAIVAGKTHMVEFAAGLTGENQHYGDCPHPRFSDRLSGGSSSGSAALVAADVVPFAIGTDTGGSVRVPASFCGLYGFRLTPGDDLIRDAFPLAPSMDTAGWFTGNGADMLNATQVLASLQPAAQTPRGWYLPLHSLLDGADAETAQACNTAAMEFCPAVDATTRETLLQAWRDTVDAYVIIGMHEANQVHRNWLNPFRERYEPAIWQRFTDGGRFPPEKIAWAKAVRERVNRTWRQFFESFDFLVLPCVPGPAPRKADCTPALRQQILALTAPASLGGLPVLSLPVSLPSGLTAGLQIVAATPNSPVFAWALAKNP
ncbi:MAG: amidase [Opitutaceae bacterium]|nr:amidase [Opitutaceae bacterium]